MFTARLFGGMGEMSCPASSISPSVGVSNPASMRINVVLPQPEGPSRAKNSRSKISMDRSSIAVKLPKRLVTFWNLIRGVSLGSSQGAKTHGAIGA